MIEEVRRYCKAALAEGRLDLVYGIMEQDGACVPHFFDASDDLERLILPGKVPLAFTCRPGDDNIVSLVQRRYPDLKIGIVARGCDERALFELTKRFQTSLDRIEIIGVACDLALAQECRCSRPYPENLRFGQRPTGEVEDPAFEKFLKMSLEERRAFWEYQFSKCMKCYGCRNACPMCFCKDCRMEHDALAKSGLLPPEFPIFHFVGMLHHADRCIDCGECETACPMDIPLRLLKKYMRAQVQELFGYESGGEPACVSPLAKLERGGLKDAE